MPIESTRLVLESFPTALMGRNRLLGQIFSKRGEKRIAYVALREQPRQHSRLIRKHGCQLLVLPFRPVPFMQNVPARAAQSPPERTTRELSQPDFAAVVAPPRLTRNEWLQPIRQRIGEEFGSAFADTENEPIRNPGRTVVVDVNLGDEHQRLSKILE